jgi:hypothetical protein
MKQNKILISEIARIQELMTGNLILEQWTKIVDDIIEYAGKLSGKLPDNVDNLIKKLGTVATEEETLKILSDIANQSDEMAQIILPKIMSTISDVETKSINDFKSLIKQSFDDGLDPERLTASVDDWVNRNVQTNFDGIKQIIKKDLYDYVDGITQKQTPSPKPTTKPKPKTKTDVGKQTWEDITPLSDDELRNLEKLYRQKGLGKSFFRLMRAFSQEVMDMFKSQYKLMDETLSLIKSYNIASATQKTDIGKKIGDNLKLLTNKEADNFTDINNWIETNVLDYKLKSKIKDLKGYKRAGAIFDNKAFVDWLGEYKQFFTRRRNLTTQMNSLLNPASWFGDNITKWKKDGGNAYLNKWKALISGQEFGELRRWAATGQTQKWSGIKKFKEDFGFLPAIGNVTKEIAWTYVRLAAIYTIADYLSDLFGNFVRDWDYINQNWWIVKQINSYDEHSEKINTVLENDKAKGYEIFLKKLGLYGLEEIKELGLAIPGFSDEFGVLLGIINTKGWSKQFFEKAEKVANDVKDKTKKEIDRITKEGKEVTTSLTSDIFYKKYPCYKNQLDTTYNNDGFVNGVKIVNQTQISLRGLDNISYNATLKRDTKWHFDNDENIIISCP